MQKKSPGPPLAATIVFCTMLCLVGSVQSLLELQQGGEQSALGIFRRPPLPRHLRTFEERLETSSWLTALLRPPTQFLQFRWLQDAGDKVVVGQDGWYFYQPGVRYSTARRRPSIDSNSAEAAIAICDFRDQLAARGIRLIVMPAPNKESVYPGSLTQRAANLSHEVSPETESLFAALQAGGVDVLDLFTLFKQAGTAGGVPLYLSQDSHWSPAGLRLAAWALAERLKQQGLDLRADTPMDETEIVVTRHGDLLQMLQAPLIEQHVAAERIVCQQVICRDSGRPCEGTTDSEVLIMGDSFLRIFESDDPGSAGLVSHLARELSQPLTVLVSDGGASTLVRQELFRRGDLLAGKKVVIWEFVERDIRYGFEGWQVVPLPPPSASP